MLCKVLSELRMSKTCTAFTVYCLHQCDVISTWSTSLHPTISRSQNSQYHRHLHRALQAWLLQLTLLQPTKYSTKPSSTHPKFSRTCRRQGLSLPISKYISDN